MTVSISPIYNDPQFFNTDGTPLNGGFIYTYQAGSDSVLQTTYSDYAGSVPNSNPIVLDASGYLNTTIWLIDGDSYNLVLTDANNVPLRNVDNITGVQAAGGSTSGNAISVWNPTSAPTYVNSTNFLVVGNQTTEYAAGNRVQIQNSDSSVNYGTVSASVFTNPNTQVTVINDNTVLSSLMTNAFWSSLISGGKTVDADGVSYNSSFNYTDPSSVGYAIQGQTTSINGLAASILNTYKVLPATGGPTYVVTADSGITSYTNGQRFTVAFDVASSSGATVNINGLGPITLLMYSSSGSLTNPVITAAMVADIAYNGTNFIMLDQLPTAPSNVTLANFTGGNQSLNPTSLYQSIPGTLLMQAGQFTCPGGGSYLNVSFPTPFPTHCVACIATSGDASKVLAVNSVTNSYVRVQNGGGFGNYIAFGY